ncbi:hypothetical protein BWQ96_09647 [Gracilariopsis chorda]|uniref:Uncharacterized protein n=1 Tax=Gracilariopsis chorda TaxID=448386 RepID=A0A2V3IF17_9FLOR|nr:hypothetical protein BWQ96_09647 [Gracilariopsis chorda]|eukprot:PXF40641.1 hypothetical protein BWQ96_09647 [Gracilariopsis chorda]
MRLRFNYKTTYIIDLLLSQAAVSMTFPSRTGSVLENLRALHVAEREQAGQYSDTGEITVNTGLAKIGDVLTQGEELDLDLLVLVSPLGQLRTKENHRLDVSRYRSSYIMHILSDFAGEEYDLREVGLPYSEAEATWGTVPDRSDEMKEFVRETAAVPVGRWCSFRRLWQEGMYHLSLTTLGLHVSRFPHGE